MDAQPSARSDRIVFEGPSQSDARWHYLHGLVWGVGILIAVVYSAWRDPQRDFSEIYMLALWLAVFFPVYAFRILRLRRRKKDAGVRDVIFSFGVATFIVALARLALTAMLSAADYSVSNSLAYAVVGFVLAAASAAHMVSRPAKDILDHSIVIDRNGVEFADVMFDKRVAIPFARLQSAKIDGAAVELAFAPADINADQPEQRRSKLRLAAWRAEPREVLEAIERFWRADAPS